jgi:hypothetical protein
MHHHKTDYRFADLNDKELEKIREAEQALNSQTDQGNRDENIILLAFKQQPQSN